MATWQRRSSRGKRVVHATFAALLAGAVSLIFGFALGLQDARWTDAWTGIGHAFTLGSPQTDSPGQS